MHKFAIIADDLTGAMDTGGQFAQAGFRTLVHIGQVGQPPGEIAVVDTESRETTPEDAARRARDAAQGLQGAPIYKKIDSTLRGHIGQELDAVMDALGLTRAVVCPAFPAAGRAVVEGRLWVHGVPLRQTDFAQDPLCPPTDHIASLLAGQSRRPVAEVPLQVVRKGWEALAEALAARPEPILVVDAAEPDELAALARALAHLGNETLGCGSAGLAQALPGAFALEPEGRARPRPPASAGPVLVVAGSQRAITRQQIQVAAERGAEVVHLSPPLDEAAARHAAAQAAQHLQAGRDVILTTAFQPHLPGQDQAIARRLGQVAAEIAHHQAPAGWVLTGGAVAFAVCRRLGIPSLEIGGEVAPGIPFGRVVGGPWDGTPLVTKAGGFGAEDALAAAIAFLHGGKRE
ncbi:MAG: four-carbon acid sugar kinase family protein [Anaerolineae bacterium]|nr:four-carbon acid sugar kinase family protein [Anaerolineae bacterium]